MWAKSSRGRFLFSPNLYWQTETVLLVLWAFGCTSSCSYELNQLLCLDMVVYFEELAQMLFWGFYIQILGLSLLLVLVSQHRSLVLSCIFHIWFSLNHIICPFFGNNACVKDLVKIFLMHVMIRWFLSKKSCKTLTWNGAWKLDFNNKPSVTLKYCNRSVYPMNASPPHTSCSNDNDTPWTSWTAIHSYPVTFASETRMI